MKSIFLTAFLLLSLTIFSQTGSKNFIDQNYIEVVGTSKREVAPDKIYLSVKIDEKDNKGKVSMQELETKMLNKLKELGLDLEEQVVIKDLTSNFQFYFLLKPDVFKSKDFEILVYEARTAGQVIVELAKEGISNISVSKLENSKIEELQFEVKQEAVKNAQEKAKGLVSAIDQKIGRAIHVEELDETGGLYDVFTGGGFKVRGYASESNFPILNFESITIESRILVKFILE